MSENLIKKEEEKQAAREESASQKWFRENPEAKEFAEKIGVELARRQRYAEQLETELGKLTSILATVVRLNGACRMKPDDLGETYQALTKGTHHLAMIKSNGDEIRAIWKVGPAPKSPVDPLQKKAQDLTDPED
jgi:hypothetical protein